MLKSNCDSPWISISAQIDSCWFKYQVFPQAGGTTTIQTKAEANHGNKTWFDQENRQSRQCISEALNSCRFVDKICGRKSCDL